MRWARPCDACARRSSFVHNASQWLAAFSDDDLGASLHGPDALRQLVSRFGNGHLRELAPGSDREGSIYGWIGQAAFGEALSVVFAVNWCG
jgi:hypothetical protein